METWRVVLLGDRISGKTALAAQFTLNCFIYDPTLEPYRKQLGIDDQTCVIEVIDTAGQDEYPTLRDQWIREGQAYILVYSITSRSTFDRLEILHQSIRRLKGNDPIFMLVGNKCDKTFEREVSKEEGAAMAQRFNCGFFETSAKTAQNVERPFINLVRALRQRRDVEAKGSKTKGKIPNKCIIM